MCVCVWAAGGVTVACRRPFDVILLDEATAELDVLTRSDLAAWLAGAVTRAYMISISRMCRRCHMRARRLRRDDQPRRVRSRGSARRSLGACTPAPTRGRARSCVVLATHVFDGIDEWPTHLAFVSRATKCARLAAGPLPRLSCSLSCFLSCFLSCLALIPCDCIFEFVLLWIDSIALLCVDLSRAAKCAREQGGTVCAAGL